MMQPINKNSNLPNQQLYEQINYQNMISQQKTQQQIFPPHKIQKQKIQDIKTKRKSNNKIKNKFKSQKIAFDQAINQTQLQQNVNTFQYSHLNYHQQLSSIIPSKSTQPNPHHIKNKSTNDHPHNPPSRQTHRPKSKNPKRQQQKTNEQQLATYQLLNIQQSTTPKKLSKIKQKIHQIYKQPSPNSNYLNNFKSLYHKKYKQYLYSNSLKKLYHQSRIVQSSSQTYLKSSPDKYQSTDKYQSIKNISNFDLLKLHAQKLDKSNILLSSHIKDLSIRNSFKIQQTTRNRPKKPQNPIPQNPPIQKLQINFTTHGKTRTQFKKSSIHHQPISSRINLKYRKKSQIIHSIQQNHKHINQSFFQVNPKKFSNHFYKSQYKNQLIKSFTNRSFQYKKNHSMNSYICQSANQNNNNIDIIDDNTVIQHNQTDDIQQPPKCQQIIKIQDDQLLNQNHKSTDPYIKRYRRVLTDPNDQSKNISNQYIINNQFWPTANRAVIDKNRQNIKKINNIYQKIKSYAKHIANNNLPQQDNPKTNQNIDEFIRTKMSLIQNSTIQKTSQQLNKHQQTKSFMTCISFTDKNYNHTSQIKQNTFNRNSYPYPYQPSQKQPKSNIQNETSHKKITNSTHSRIKSDKSQSKLQNKTATRFYQPLVQKCKDKANILIADPYLKTRAIDICPKSNKKISDIIIICL